MTKPDYRDILGGGALILIGAFAAIYAFTTLRLGTMTQMGPGMFPVAMGCMLAIFGFVVLIPAVSRAGEWPNVDVRSVLAILASILAFALLVAPFGMIPAIVVLTVIASRADSKLSLLGTAILAAGLSLSAILIFRIGLGIPLAVIAWPW